jgi:hypothetical protein
MWHTGSCSRELVFGAHSPASKHLCQAYADAGSASGSNGGAQDYSVTASLGGSSSLRSFFHPQQMSGNKRVITGLGGASAKRMPVSCVFAAEWLLFAEGLTLNERFASLSNAKTARKEVSVQVSRGMQPRK